MSKEMSKDELKNELASKLMAIEQTQEVEELIKNNQLVFPVDGQNYKVRKLVYAEQMEVEKFRRKKYLEFMNDDQMLFRKQWIEKYLKKGINIDDMDKKISELQTEIDGLLMRLATTSQNSEVEKLKTEILLLKNKQAEISIEKTDLLMNSIEDQLMIAINSYYAYMALEHEIEKDKWERAFKTYDEFLNSNNQELLNKTFYFVNLLIYQLPF
jgi:hypothetical protein